MNVSARADMLAGASLAGVALSGVTMGLPQRLRDAGVSQDALPDLAKIVFANHTIRNNPKPITDVAQLMTLLQQAW